MKLGDDIKKDSGFDPRSGNFSKNRLACVRAVVKAVSKKKTIQKECWETTKPFGA